MNLYDFGLGETTLFPLFLCSKSIFGFVFFLWVGYFRKDRMGLVFGGEAEGAVWVRHRQFQMFSRPRILFVISVLPTCRSINVGKLMFSGLKTTEWTCAI